MTYRIIIAFLFCTILAGCKSAKVDKTRTVNDSISVRVDTRIEYVHDTIVEKVLEQTTENLTKDSFSRLENEYCVSYASTFDGMLYHSLHTKAHDIYHDVLTPVIYKDSIRVEYVTIKESNDVFVDREKTKWERICLTGFPIILIIVILIILYLLYKGLKKSLDLF